MLVNHEIKPFLLPIPLPGFQDRRTFAAAANDFYSLKVFFARRTGKIIRKPKHFMAASGQRDEISQRHALCAARQGVLRVAPVEHQETHEEV